MATNMKSSGDSQKDDGWDLISHQGTHTRERSPQYNEDNESQPQMAGSSMGIGDDYVHIDRNMSGGAGYVSRPRSDNAESQATSTETEASADTVTAVNTAGPVPVMPLTEAVLDINERQPQYGYPDSIPRWLDDMNGVGDRSIYVEYESTLASSTCFKTGKSKASTVASSIDSVGEDLAQSASSFDFRGIGGWCNRFEGVRRR